MGQIERIERRLKLHDMRVLMSVVEAGSMAKAAQRLGTSQPAVSRSIADLERTLGVRLLERSPWGVEATQYGRAIIGRGLLLVILLHGAYDFFAMQNRFPALAIFTFVILGWALKLARRAIEELQDDSRTRFLPKLVSHQNPNP